MSSKQTCVDDFISVLKRRHLTSVSFHADEIVALLRQAADELIAVQSDAGVEVVKADDIGARVEVLYFDIAADWPAFAIVDSRASPRFQRKWLVLAPIESPSCGAA